MAASADCGPTLASKSHAELDALPDIDIGDIAGLADDHAELLPLLSNLHLIGGCCGTDHRHINAICARCPANVEPLR